MFRRIGVWVLIPLGLLSACGGSSGSSNPPQSSSSSTPTTSAATRTIEGWMDGEKIEVTVVSLIDPANPKGWLPMDGYRFVAVELSIRNVGTAVYGECPDFQATIYDASGKKLTPDITDPMKPAFACQGLSVATGASVRGFVTFEVPKGVATSTLTYSEHQFGRGQAATWPLAT